MSVLVTGGSGFIGGALLRALADAGGRGRIVAATRRPAAQWPPGVRPQCVGELSEHTDWTDALRGVRVVVHAAARVHVVRDTAPDPLAEYRRSNVDGTLALARQAAAAGVERFVFLSSIKVNGEATAPGKPFTPHDRPAPQDPYGASKWAAEEGLRALAARSGMQFVIIRPPLVYGPGVGGNLRSLMAWIDKGWPLPLGALTNKRSLLALDNLVDLIVHCLDEARAANQLLLAADGQDLSTTQLVRALGRALGRPARLLPVPEPLLRAATAAVGRGDIGRRLCDSLQVDASDSFERIGWRPGTGFEDALLRTGRHFLNRRRR